MIALESDFTKPLRSRNFFKPFVMQNFTTDVAGGGVQPSEGANVALYPDDITDICDRRELPTPAYLVHSGLLAENLAKLDEVQQRTGARIILALKAFAMHAVFPQIRKVLKGTTASSLNEARLGVEEFGGEVHAYCVAYSDHEIDWLSKHATHITFNSVSQLRRFKPVIEKAGHGACCGLRINPAYCEIDVELYNPCRPGSRFGVLPDQLADDDLQGVDGLHFHALCEQDADVLERTLAHVEEGFGKYLHRVKWLNMGGGHHITRKGYNVDLLCDCIDRIQRKYYVQVYLEPGEAVAFETGFLVAGVLDILRSGDTDIALLDTSASAHMPDLLEMPYRAVVVGAGYPGEKRYTYQLGGITCLSGDVIGEYSFDQPLKVGDRLVFTDMAHYTMVKNTMFNGIPLPSIAVYEAEHDRINVLRQFGYEDYRNRLS